MFNDIKLKLKNLIQGGFFHILLGNSLVKMIAFISSIVVVRLVSKQDYAYLTYADNLYSYINLVAGLGMSSAILKYCAGAPTAEEDKAYFRFAVKYGTLFQILLSVVLVIYVYASDIPFSQARSIILLSLLYPAVTHILATTLSYIRAHLNNKLYVQMSVVQTLVVFVGSVCLVLMFSVNGIVFARYIATAAALIMAFKFVKSCIHNTENVKLSRKQIKGFMGMSISLMVANLFSMIMASNELMLVNYLIADEVATANYRVANLIPSQLPFITSSIVVYYFPIIARMENKKKEAWEKLKKMGVLTIGIIATVVIIGSLCSPIIIALAYGSKYEDASGLFVIFWIIHGINAGFRMIPMNMLPALGHTKFNAVLSIGTCAVHIVIDYVCIKTMGIMGAGIASGIVYAISGVLYWGYLYYVCKKEGVSLCQDS